MVATFDKANSPFLTVGRLHIFISASGVRACHMLVEGQSSFLHQSK